MPFESPNHTQTPNDLFDVYLPLMGEAELKITMALVRLTFGYHQTKVKASIRKLAEMTGLSKQGVTDGAKAAEERGLIKYLPNKAGSEWVVNVVGHGVQASRTPDVQASRTRTSRLNKESMKEIFKEISPFLSREFYLSWEEWFTYRSRIGKPISEFGMRKQFKIFVKEKYTERDLIEMIDFAISKDWQGIYPVKKNGHPPTKPAAPPQYVEEH